MLFRRLAFPALAVAALPVFLTAQQQAPPPQSPPRAFRASVDLVAVDVHVVDKEGWPIDGLTPAQFDVTIDGRRRTVSSADLIQFADLKADLLTQLQQRQAAVDAAFTGTAAQADGRRYVLAIDETSFKTGNIAPLMQITTRFLRTLEPNDLVSLHSYPVAGPRVAFTRDHSSIIGALGRVTGLAETPPSSFHLALSEIIDLTARDSDVMTRVMQRECRPTDTSCASRLRAEADSIAGFLEAQVMQSLGGLQTLLQQLQQIPGRKTLVLLSGGLMVSDRGGGRPDAGGTMMMLGAEAAAANTNVYILHVDTSFIDAYAANAPKTDRSLASRDSYARSLGLDLVAGAAGGTMIRVEAGSPDFAFARVMRETSAYYLLGVEPDDADRDGKLHYLNVKVNRKGALVRSRTQVVIPERR